MPVGVLENPLRSPTVVSLYDTGGGERWLVGAVHVTAPLQWLNDNRSTKQQI
jgi:hypothetical protein